MLYNNVRGREGGRLSEGVLLAILAERVGAYSGEGAYYSVAAYSRKYDIFLNKPFYSTPFC